MSEYLFGTGSGHLSEAAARIAKRHRALLVNHVEPYGEKTHWFVTANRGAPFNLDTAKAVLRDLLDADILKPNDPRVVNYCLLHDPHKVKGEP